MRHRDGHRACRRPPERLVVGGAARARAFPSRRHRRPEYPRRRSERRGAIVRGDPRVSVHVRERRARRRAERVTRRRGLRLDLRRRAAFALVPLVSLRRLLRVRQELAQRARVQPRVRGGIVQRREVRDEREARALRLLRGVRLAEIRVGLRVPGSVVSPRFRRSRQRVRDDECGSNVLLVERRASGAVQPRHGRREFRAGLGVRAISRAVTRARRVGVRSKTSREERGGHRRRGRVRRDGHL